jgi:hypothetical protein
MSLAPVVPPLGVGLHFDVPAEIYHADPCAEPSLSSSLVREIDERSPLHARMLHPKLGGASSDSTRAMDLGSLIHALLAGESTFEVGNFDDFKTKAAREWRDGVKAGGKLPILEHTLKSAEPVVASIKEKAGEGITNDPFKFGVPEVTAIWQDDEAWCRARFDRLVMLPDAAYADIWDWKTTTTVAPDKLLRKIVDDALHIRAAHYIRGLRRLAPQFAGRISFILGFVEVDPPYSFRRVVMSEGFRSIGEMICHRATEQWKTAMKTNVWPDGTGQTFVAEPPTWYIRKFEEDVA